jgi:hypothetical protein
LVTNLTVVIKQFTGEKKEILFEGARCNGSAAAGSKILDVAGQSALPVGVKSGQIVQGGNISFRCV